MPCIIISHSFSQSPSQSGKWNGKKEACSENATALFLLTDVTQIGSMNKYSKWKEKFRATEQQLTVTFCLHNWDAWGTCSEYNNQSEIVFSFASSQLVFSTNLDLEQQAMIKLPFKLRIHWWLAFVYSTIHSTIVIIVVIICKFK